MVELSSPAPLSSSTLNNTLGALYIAIILHAILYGISIVQFCIYFRNNAREDRTTRVLIFCLGILTSTIMALWIVTGYQFLITYISTPLAPAAGPIPWYFLTDWILCVIEDVAVAGVYTARLWRLGGKYVVPFVIVQIILDTMSLGFGITYPILGLHTSTESLSSKYMWIYVTEFSCKTLSNASIAASLCYTLWSMRTGQRRTDNMIWMLMKFSISTCIIVSLITFIAIVALVAAPNTFIFLIADSVQPKIALNALLAFQNSRAFIRRTTSSDPVSIQLTRIHHLPPSSNSGESADRMSDLKDPKTGLSHSSTLLNEGNDEA